MAVPGTFTSGQVLTAAEMNALPGGIAATGSNAADVNITTGSFTNVVTATLTTISGRKYLVHASGLTDDASTTLIATCEIRNSGGTRYNLMQVIASTTYDRFNATMFAFFTGSGGSETIEFRAIANTGSFNFKGTTEPSVIAIYDMGD